MRSIRFGLVMIAVCGALAVGSVVQVAVWGLGIAELDQKQEAIGDQILALRGVMSRVLNLEDGQRGYLLTGEERFLEPYHTAAATLQPALDRLRELAQSDPATRESAREIAALAGKRQEEVARPIALRRAGDVTGAIDFVRSGQGKQTMDELRGKSDMLVEHLRQVRRDAMQRQTQVFWRAAALSGVVLLLILLLISSAILWLNASIRRLDELQRVREREAMHDPLTGLPNRRYLHEMLGRAVAAAQRIRQRLVVLYFDLDAFKAVNDRLGHDAGDRVLQVTAERLRQAVRSSDFVARLGGDEFVAVLPVAPADPELSALVARLEEDLAKPPIPGMAEGEFASSIGIACYPEDGATPEALLTAADRAMYAVKEAHRAAAGKPELRTAAVEAPAD